MVPHRHTAPFAAPLDERATTLGRRDALRRMAQYAVAWCAAPVAVRPRGHAGCAAHHAQHHHHASTPAHPTPRAGITAARVLTAAQLRAIGAPEAIDTFDEVRQIPQIVDGIRCHCGCADEPGYYSLLSCYEGDGMARLCAFCTGQGRMAFRLARAGSSLDEIRAAIDNRYG